MKILITLLIITTYSFHSYAQVEVSTQNEILTKNNSTIFSQTSLNGYGNIFYQRNNNLKKSNINLERFMFILKHQFNHNISLFTEVGVEDTKPGNAEQENEIVIQQAYVKFNINSNNYLVAGLFLPRIAILNEHHLPTTFFGNERNQVETYIIPSTWRQLGIAYYRTSTKKHLAYFISLTTGLNSATFEHGTGIRNGRFSSRNSTANNLALIGAIQYKKNNFEAQVSGYYGGSVGLSPNEADSLKLESGLFGTPVVVGEAHTKYTYKGLVATLLASTIAINKAVDINRAYASNTPKNEYGTYAELAYNIFEKMKIMKPKELYLFARYEMLNLNAAIPSNGILDKTLNQQHLIIGFNYLPLKNIVLKTDIRLMNTGKENPDLMISPGSSTSAYQQQNAFMNIGLAYFFLRCHLMFK